jgi:hypothetical protein
MDVQPAALMAILQSQRTDSHITHYLSHSAIISSSQLDLPFTDQYRVSYQFEVVLNHEKGNTLAHVLFRIVS